MSSTQGEDWGVDKKRGNERQGAYRERERSDGSLRKTRRQNKDKRRGEDEFTGECPQREALEAIYT